MAAPKIQQLFESPPQTLPDISLRPDSAARTSRVKGVGTGVTLPAPTAAAGDAGAAATRKPSFPLTPSQALELFQRVLTPYEQEEIKQYSHVYFLGQQARKINAHEGKENNSGYDDEKGRYKCVKNDHVAYRYEIVRGLGKGSFGDVIKVVDHKTKTQQALKIIRNEKRFHKQGQIEIKILDLLRKQDRAGKYNLIHMTDWFVFRNHLCITFDLMHSDLYSALKKDGFKGFTLKQVQKFGTSLLSSLRLLRRNRVIHCDLKPENILLRSKDSDDIVVIDFGSSCLDHQKVHSYIQSRFYRSPEVILGLGYGLPIDMWSLGCILVELYTGHPIFPGRDEKEQLLYQMEVLGVPPKALRERGKRTDLFFYADGTPRYLTDRKGNKRIPGTRTLAKAIGSTDSAFLDFVSRCLTWDPATRMTPREASRHEFITGKTMPAKLIRSLSDGLAAVRMLPLGPASPASAAAQQSLDRHQRDSNSSAAAEPASLSSTTKSTPRTPSAAAAAADPAAAAAPKHRKPHRSISLHGTTGESAVRRSAAAAGGASSGAAGSRVRSAGSRRTSTSSDTGEAGPHASGKPPLSRIPSGKPLA